MGPYRAIIFPLLLIPSWALPVVGPPFGLQPGLPHTLRVQGALVDAEEGPLELHEKTTLAQALPGKNVPSPRRDSTRAI